MQVAPEEFSDHSAQARDKRTKRAAEREAALCNLPPLFGVSPAPMGHNGGPALLPRRPGRPTKQTPEMRAAILDRLADGIPLRTICRQPDMPSRTTVYDWRSADFEFDRCCQIMRQEGISELAIRLVEEIDGLCETRGSKFARMVYRIRLWQLARLHPQVFGGGSWGQALTYRCLRTPSKLTT